MAPTLTLEGTVWHPRLPVRLGVLDDDARFAFTHGQCHAFATALAEATGGEVAWGGREECVDLTGGPQGWDSCDEPPLPSGLCPCQVDHLLVRVGGRFLDVRGAHDGADLTAEEFEVVLPLADADLAAICVHPAWRAPALGAARALVPTYLAWLEARGRG